MLLVTVLKLDKRIGFKARVHASKNRETIMFYGRSENSFILDG